MQEGFLKLQKILQEVHNPSRQGTVQIKSLDFLGDWIKRRYGRTCKVELR
jgi:hypothetical protein